MLHGVMSGDQAECSLAAAHAVQVMFMLPFGIWGLMMIVINTIAHAQLATVGSPVALFNLVRHLDMLRSATLRW